VTGDLSHDDVLLDLLSSVIDELDPVAPDAVKAAHAAAGMAHADEELATLVEEAAAEEALLLADESQTAFLTFRSAQLTVEIEIHAGSHVIGMLSPPTASVVQVEAASSAKSRQETMTTSDELGRFRLHVGEGLNRLRIDSGSEAVVTSWFYC
jgi:hypothetical protein